MINKGHVAVITDACSSAAEAIAKRLEDDGMTVIRNYPNGFPEGVSVDLKCNFSFDTCSEIEMRKFLKVAIENVGNINHLIHTDNVVFRSSIEEITEEDFKCTMDRNAKSAFITAKVFGEHFAVHGSGSILYLSTLHDEKPTGCAFAYSAAKGAVKMLCKEMALFYGRKGVRANIIQMGCTKENGGLLDSVLSPFNYDIHTKIPLHRSAAPEDFTGAAAFLLSEDAAFINGAEIRVDGGHLLYYRDR